MGKEIERKLNFQQIFFLFFFYSHSFFILTSSHSLDSQSTNQSSGKVG